MNQKSIAVLTSGGDCQGMNSVIYGISYQHNEIQKENHNHPPLYLILNGFQGLIDGSIMKADHKFLKQNHYLGGTIIGSSRCREFYHQDGRRKAVKSLLNLNIEKLIVIGGDGSLFGANLLRKEWPQHVRELIEKGELDPKQSKSELNLVGIIGSIDNDFYGTEMTVGANSALVRVVECIDALKTTAKSHNRVMVVEVMGRNCGYLALSAALSTEASYVFIPEMPQKSTEEWQQKLKIRLNEERKKGKYYHIIIVSEGACDQDGLPIKSQYIKDFLNKDCNLEVRLIVLGHFQRGGYTTMFDHLISLQMGIEAYNILLKQLDVPMILTLDHGKIQTKFLVHCIEQMKKLTEYVKEKNWTKVIEHRGRNFINTWENFRNLMSQPSPSSLNKISNGLNSWAIVQCGRPMPGMNAIVYALVRYGYAQNITVFGFHNGIEGLVNNNVHGFQWQDVLELTEISGTMLGSRPKQPIPRHTKIDDNNIEQIMETLQSNRIKFICFIGDQIAYEAIKSLYKYRNHYAHLIDSKYCYIPVSSNEPMKYQEVSCSKLGHDSMLNKTMKLIIDLIISTNGTFNQLYLIQINLNMIFTLFAEPGLFSLAVGASLIYPLKKSLLNQTDINLDLVASDAKQLSELILKTHENKFVLIHESLWLKIIPIYEEIFKKFGHQIRLHQIDLTEIQMPTSITPFDRKLGVKLGMECGRYFSNENIKTAEPIIINTPFLYESKPIKIN